MATSGSVENLQEKKAGTRIASYLFTEYLERLGVEYVFGTCGHTNIALLDALSRSRIRFVIARHEQAAAHAADGYARVSGKPGVLLLHVGPGMMNAVTGVATAALDSVPLVAITGDVPSYYEGRHPHQEVNLHADADQTAIYRPFTKRTWHVHRAEDLPRFTERAFWTATSGRPGAVLLNVPMDIFSRPCPAELAAGYPLPADAGRPGLPADVADRIADLLVQAERPLIYIGGGLREPTARKALLALAEHLDIPIAHSLMAKGTVPDSHPLLLGMTGFWGTPGLPTRNALACMGRAIIGGSTAVGWLVVLRLAAHWFPDQPLRHGLRPRPLFRKPGRFVRAGPSSPRRRVFRLARNCSRVRRPGPRDRHSGWIIVRDDPSEKGLETYAPIELQKHDHVRIWESLRSVFSFKNTWLILIAQGGMVGPIMTFTGLWGAPFLKARFVLEPKAAATICSVMIVCWAIASPVFGAFSDKIRKRKPAYLIGSLGCTFGWIVMIYTALPLPVFTAVAALTSFSTGCVVIAFAYGRESVPAQHMGSVTATTNIGNMLGNVLLQPGIGLLLDRNWTGEMAKERGSTAWTPIKPVSA